MGKPRGRPSKKKKRGHVQNKTCQEGGQGSVVSTTKDAALETIFSLIISLLDNGSNVWLTPDDISSFLCQAGVSKYLTGFHVRMAIQRYIRKGILKDDRSQLPESDGRSLYYRLASVLDAETPLTQRLSESGRRRRFAVSLPSDWSLHQFTCDQLKSIEEFCQLVIEDNSGKKEHSDKKRVDDCPQDAGGEHHVRSGARGNVSNESRDDVTDNDADQDISGATRDDVACDPEDTVFSGADSGNEDNNLTYDTGNENVICDKGDKDSSGGNADDTVFSGADSGNEDKDVTYDTGNENVIHDNGDKDSSGDDMTFERDKERSRNTVHYGNLSSNCRGEDANGACGGENSYGELSDVDSSSQSGSHDLTDGTGNNLGDSTLSGESGNNITSVGEPQHDSSSDAEDAGNTNISGKRGYRVLDMDLELEFLQLIFRHGFECKGQGRPTLKLITRDKDGWAMKDCFQCSCCKKLFDFKTSAYTKTEAVAPGRKYSRLQPVLNILVSNAAKQFGIGYTQLRKLALGIGLQAPTKTNAQDMGKKVQAAIKKVGKKCLIENRREHVRLCRAQDEYKGDIKWTGPDGEQRSIARGPVDTDGAGSTRSYNNRHTGSQHCSIMNSGLSKLPIGIVHKQISCVMCQRAMTKAIAEGKQVTDATLSHHGICYRNSCHGPAVAEENSAATLAKDLLLDENGDYVGDDLAIFVDQICCDGDTKAAKKFIQAQIEILGDIVKDIAETMPDIGHSVKCMNNDWYKVGEEKSLKGKNLLEPKRIRALCGDVISAFKWYREKFEALENPSESRIDALQTDCLKRLENIVPHHCGMHGLCQSDLCGFVKLKEEHPEWDPEKLDAEYDKIARFNGAYMSLSERGMEAVSRVITKRVNKGNLSRLAAMKSSNASENFFMCATVHTQGKRLNLDQTDAWESILYGVAAEKTLKRKYPETVGKLMGIDGENVIQKKMRHAHYRAKEQDKIRKQTPAYQNRRKVFKLMKATRVAKESAKKECYRPGKVPLGSNEKSGQTSEQDPASKKTFTCGFCGVQGHRRNNCPLPGPSEPTKKSKGAQKDNDMDWFDSMC